MREFRDRDFVQTTEGFFFCVVGSVHPAERVISYIKYVPSESGVWGNADSRFSRILQKYTIPNLLQTFNYLEKNYPQYLFHSPADNIKITAVPTQNIKQHFKPEEKLAQLRQASQLDSLQKMLIRFTKFLEETSGVPQTAFGVTGSLLLDIHQPTFSDLDITVYGTKDSWALQKALTEQCNESAMRRLKGDTLKEWAIKKTENYPLTASEASKIYAHKWNLGIFENRWVSIHPVKLENEVTEQYGAKSFQPIGQVTLNAVVHDNTDSLFLPAVYKVKDVTVLDDPTYENIVEVVSYESLYDSLAENGETIQVKGKLERVTEKGSSHQHYRVVVGSAEGKGKEYIKRVD